MPETLKATSHQVYTVEGPACWNKLGIFVQATLLITRFASLKTSKTVLGSWRAPLGGLGGGDLFQNFACLAGSGRGMTE